MCVSLPHSAGPDLFEGPPLTEFWRPAVTQWTKSRTKAGEAGKTAGGDGGGGVRRLATDFRC